MNYIIGQELLPNQGLLACGSCYFVMLYFWGMNEKEKQDVQHMLKRGKK